MRGVADTLNNQVLVGVSYAAYKKFSQKREVVFIKQELVVSSHAIGENNFHFVFVSTYRRDIFVTRLMQELTLAYIIEKMQKLDVQLLAYTFCPYHLHLFFSNLRKVVETEFVRQIKGYSFFMI